MTITQRRQPLDLDSALCWRGQHCFITSICPLGRLYLTVEAALVEPYLCSDPRDGTTFPAVVTEEYRGHDQLEPMAINTHRRVLVATNAIKLSPGSLVEGDHTPWPILTPYEMDPHKNECVIGRTVALRSMAGWMRRISNQCRLLDWGKLKSGAGWIPKKVEVYEAVPHGVNNPVGNRYFEGK